MHMKTPSQPLSILARALCLAVLLFSQYALATHAVEHPFHNLEQGCEAYQGVPNLDQALQYSGEQSTASLRDCLQARFFIPF